MQQRRVLQIDMHLEHSLQIRVVKELCGAFDPERPERCWRGDDLGRKLVEPPEIFVRLMAAKSEVVGYRDDAVDTSALFRRKISGLRRHVSIARPGVQSPGL